MELKPLPIVISKSMPREEKARLFDEKYGEFFRALAVMPRTNADNSLEVNRAINKERRDNFRALFGVAWDEFVLDIMNVFNVRYDISENAQSSTREDASDNGMAVLESLNEAIYYFDNIDKPDTFRIMIAAYKNKKLSKSRISDREIFNNKFAGESSKRKQMAMINVFRQMERMFSCVCKEDFSPDMPRTVSQLSKETFIKIAMKIIDGMEGTISLTEKDMDAFYYLAVNGSNSVSMDKSIGEDDEEATLHDVIADVATENIFCSIENTEIIDGFLACVYDILGMEAFLPPKDREILRLFLTYDILKELKLNGDGKPYLTMPAGNEEVYNLLVPSENILVGEATGLMRDRVIFYQDFICYVFEEHPKNLEEIYRYLLKHGIKMNQTDIQQCMGYGSRGTVTKKADRYEEIMKGVRLFYEQQ